MEGADLARRRLVVAANRGPVSFHDDPSGEPVVTRGPGGLVTVLTEVLRHHPGTWVAAALSDAERRLAAEDSAVEVALDGEEYRVRYVAPPPDAYHKYYNVVSNPMLWFIQHYLWDLGRHPDIRAEEMDAWHNGYLVVNGQFARAVVDEVRRGTDGRRRRGPDGDGGDALVLVHDYQLYCVAPDVRAACPGAFLHQFIHIPWPQSDYWRVLPRHIREAVFRGLLGNDVVAFHTRHYVRNFLRCCEDLLELEVDEARGAVRYDGRDRRRLPPGAHRRAQAAQQAARVPPAACRPPGPQQEHHPRLRGARPVPRAPSRVQGAADLPRSAAAVARRRGGVRHLPRARGARRRRCEHAPRHRGRTTSRSRWPPTRSTTCSS